MEKNYGFLTERPFAHRGYHSSSLYDSGKIPENSLEAFKLAIEKNYAIEMDIHLTKDFEIIVFHDFFLGRLTTKTGFVFNKNLNYIAQARLSNNEPVPTLEDTFNLINGRVPVLLEIKDSNLIKKKHRSIHKGFSRKARELQRASGLNVFQFRTNKVYSQK